MNLLPNFGVGFTLLNLQILLKGASAQVAASFSSRSKNIHFGSHICHYNNMYSVYILLCTSCRHNSRLQCTHQPGQSLRLNFRKNCLIHTDTRILLPPLKNNLPNMSRRLRKTTQVCSFMILNSERSTIDLSKFKMA